MSARLFVEGPCSRVLERPSHWLFLPRQDGCASSGDWVSSRLPQLGELSSVCENGVVSDGAGHYVVMCVPLAWGGSEVALVHLTTVDRRFRPDPIVATTIACRLFEQGDEVARDRYASILDDARRYAERGELGCTIVVGTLPGGSTEVSLVERRLTESGVRAETLAKERFGHRDGLPAAEFVGTIRAVMEERNEAIEVERRQAIVDYQLTFDERREREDDAEAIRRALKQERDEHGNRTP